MATDRSVKIKNDERQGRALACEYCAPVRRLGGACRCGQLPQHVLQDAAVAKVLALLRRVDAHACLKANGLCLRGRGGDGDHARLAALKPADLKHFVSVDSQRLRALPSREL